ncbi:B12-binding domain-containing radical SAM protein [Micromonospora sp. NPDC003241]
MSDPVHQRLLDTITHATGQDASADARLRHVSLTEPTAMTDALARWLPGRFTLTGTLDRRLLLAEHCDRPGWTVTELNGEALASRDWPAWTRHRINVEHPHRWLSTGTLTDDGAHRLLHPTILLTALYHAEHFPLPRFPLAISDLARAARATLSGQVRLMDMQLGNTLEDLTAAIETRQPDIVGISATFGQHDLMIRLLDHLYSRQRPPLVLAGGSLTARNERVLLQQYPHLLIARGAGEPTIADIISHVHGDLPLHAVRGLGYAGAATPGRLTIGRTIRHTATVANRSQEDFLPELDLLGSTFEHRGVAQLETSRGCTNTCSFCPRSHKGRWAGGPPQKLPWILREIRTVFDRHPDISRTLYLVDEEIIGGDADAVPRVLSLAATLHQSGFRWESSCRIDQVVDLDRDRAWHIERATMWRHLLALGLRRMLFGVESGVTSILQRFNKETTAEQNVLAVRTLSALGVPTRFTYITFDQMMSLDELKATHDFQARTDLLLKPLPQLAVEEIVDGVRDQDFVATHSQGRPFYTAISYMLVGMECLIGAAYTRRAHAAGLTGAPDPTMGRVEAHYADWRIGRAAYHAQLWIDRNFALDYTCKSLEKILDGPPQQAIRTARATIKDHAFNVLARSLDLIATRSPAPPEPAHLDTALRVAMDGELLDLADHMAATVARVLPALPADAADLLSREFGRWQRRYGDWQLINASDPCGT